MVARNDAGMTGMARRAAEQRMSECTTQLLDGMTDIATLQLYKHLIPRVIIMVEKNQVITFLCSRS